MAKHGYLSFRPVLIICEKATEERLDTEDACQVRRGALSFDAHRISRSCEVVVRTLSGSQLLKGVRSFDKSGEVSWRLFYLISAFEFAPEHKQTVSFVVWERLENDGIDDAEDGSIGADAEREREDGHGGNQRVSPKESTGVSKILNERLDRWKPSPVAILFLNLFNAAELLQRSGARVDWIHSVRDFLLDLQLDVRPDLIIQLSFEACLVEERTKALEKDERGIHKRAFRWFEEARDHLRGAPPVLLFGCEPLPASGRDVVVLRSTAILGDAPFRADPSHLLEIKQGGVDSSLIECCIAVPLICSIRRAIPKPCNGPMASHGTGHWLGLDVHDAGAYRIDGVSRKLEPGMAFTVEPGLYVTPHKAEIELSLLEYDLDEWAQRRILEGRAAATAAEQKARDEVEKIKHKVPEAFLGIGVRIEDDVVITDEGHDNLTSAVPTGWEEVEALCAEESMLPAG